SEMQVVLVPGVGAEREPAGPIERPRAADVRARDHAAAVVEKAAQRSAAERSRRPYSGRCGANEVLGERGYACTTERIRSMIASTLGMIASSSGGLYEISTSSGRLSAAGRVVIGTPRIVSSEITVAPQPAAWTCSSTTTR